MAYTLYRSRGKDVNLSSVILLHPKTIVAFNKTMFVLIILTLYLFILHVIRRSIFWIGSPQQLKLQYLPTAGLFGNHIKLLIWLPMQQIHELIELGKQKTDLFDFLACFWHVISDRLWWEIVDASKLKWQQWQDVIATTTGRLEQSPRLMKGDSFHR